MITCNNGHTFELGPIGECPHCGSRYISPEESASVTVRAPSAWTVEAVHAAYVEAAGERKEGPSVNGLIGVMDLAERVFGKAVRP